MVFLDSPGFPPFLAGLVTGFTADGDVAFVSSHGSHHTLATYYSWLHIVCPD